MRIWKCYEIYNKMSYYFHEDIEKENGSESIRTEQQSRGCLFVLRLTELFAMLTEFSMGENIRR